MKRLYVYCEGQTEESFVNIILCPYLQNMDVHTIPIICTTKRTSSSKFKGGVSRYGKIKRELAEICRSHSNEMVTTMFDFYGLPNDTPFISTTVNDIYKNVQHLETAIMGDINHKNLIFNLVLHEFEGLLFADISEFKNIADDNAIAELHKIKSDFPTPEHINNSTETAPSKRIQSIIPSYKKTLDGINIAHNIGIDKMSAECHHFRRWIANIVAWANGGCNNECT